MRENYRIFKHVLAITDLQVVKMPYGSKVLHVGEQDGKLCAWTMHGTITERSQYRTFRIVGSGHVFEDPNGYVGTVVMRDGFVWHVFSTE